MLNRRGQTLVIFILLFPIIIAILAFLIDVGVMIYEDKRVDNITFSILEIDNIDEAKIVDIYKKNKVDISKLQILIDDEKIVIDNHYNVKSIFGNILNIKNYKIGVKAIKYFDDNRIILE